jgi:hypothetical protein
VSQQSGNGGEMVETDKELYLMLGQIKGAQETLTGEVRAGNKASDEGRRRMHQVIDDLRDRTETQFKDMAVRNEEQFRILSMRIDTAQRIAEGALNQVTVVSPTVSEHQSLMLQARGATTAVTQFGKIMWVFGGTILASVVTVTAFIVHLLSNSSPKP